VASFSSVSPFDTAGRAHHEGATRHAIAAALVQGPAAANRHPGKLRYGHPPSARCTSSVRGSGLDTVGAGVSIASPAHWLHVLSSSVSLRPACRPSLSTPVSPGPAGSPRVEGAAAVSPAPLVPSAMDILGRPVLSVEAARTWLEDMRAALTATLKSKGSKRVVSVSSQVAGQTEDDPVIVARQMLPWDSGVVESIYDASRRRVFSSNDMSRSDCMAMAHADAQLGGLASAVRVLHRSARLAVAAHAETEAGGAAGSVSPTTTLEAPRPSLERSRTTAGDEDQDDGEEDDAGAGTAGAAGDTAGGGTDSDTDDEGIFTGTSADLPSRAAVFGAAAASASAPGESTSSIPRRRRFSSVPWPPALSPEQCCLRWRPLASTAARILPPFFFGILDARAFFTGRMASLALMRDPLADETTPTAIPDGAYILPQVKLACLAVMRCLLLSAVARGQQAARSSKAAAAAAEAEAAGVAGATEAELAVLSKLVEGDGGAKGKSGAAAKRASRKAKQKLKRHQEPAAADAAPAAGADDAAAPAAAAAPPSPPSPKPAVPAAVAPQPAPRPRPADPVVPDAVAGEWQVVGGAKPRRKQAGGDGQPQHARVSVADAEAAAAGPGDISKSVGRRAGRGGVAPAPRKSSRPNRRRQPGAEAADTSKGDGGAGGVRRAACVAGGGVCVPQSA
jgi:hypothetical protein